ncbi:histidine kinase dimerization/phospho-acceptor domain-containing protein [Rubripirellula tenax]|uniref:histidine kinase dimerization/phospho-acceptor domain-containing protein n=1 Tax=Rubripirellula tenax TaxID=2528015 RepID=UPI001647493C|nr:histidine kinase dimerization/phospho-acceptor domain-containing protein [Rubripirellula tenax]
MFQAETRHLRELGRAAAELAHEIRNPLGLIRGWTQSLVGPGLQSDEQQEQAESFLEECDRVTARIKQFPAFARQAEADIGAVAMDELVAELQTLRLNQRHAIRADREPLRQVLFNLLQNAIAFAPEGSTITTLLNESRRVWSLQGAV